MSVTIPLRTTLRLVWNPRSTSPNESSRIPLMNAMHRAGYSSDAIDRMLADKVECVAEVEVLADGTLRVLGARRAEQCRSAKDGVRCGESEVHDGHHLAFVKRADGGTEIRRWMAAE